MGVPEFFRIIEVCFPEEVYRKVSAKLIHISKGGVTLSDIEDRLTIKEVVTYLEEFSELYKDELEILSPALLVQALIGKGL